MVGAGAVPFGFSPVGAGTDLSEYANPLGAPLYAVPVLHTMRPNSSDVVNALTQLCSYKLARGVPFVNARVMLYTHVVEYALDLPRVSFPDGSVYDLVLTPSGWNFDPAVGPPECLTDDLPQMPNCRWIAINA